MKISILAAVAHPAVELAASELEHYLALLNETNPSPPVTIRLAVSTPENPELDSYDINVNFSGDGGVITGSNPRSVLFGAYELLKMLGFRWVRPGRNGEVIPSRVDFSRPLVRRSAAGYRHRGICIEGAVSRENVLDTIEWMTRCGFNAYFIQFRNAFTFFDRWYTHQNNPLLPAEHFDTAAAERITREIRSEVRRRGLDLHMVGHGWTCEPFGIPGPGWFPHRGEIAPEIKRFFAEVNGKRELWGGIALNTNLCYGNPEVRKLIADAIAAWSVENPEVNIIHFWLADGSNNQCECPLCTPKRPADWYVEMLNLVDEKLTEVKSTAKIVFLVYVDLLWPPEQSKLKNPDRFILMFAPITRSYSRPFSPGEAGADGGEIPPYDRNHLKFPAEPEKNLAFLKCWQERCSSGSSFDFDYHYMWDHFKDPGYYRMAEILHDDCRNLRKLGLDGFVSCQAQRVFFPNGLGMTVMGRTLWDPELSFEEIASDYFSAAYGEEWEAAREYFRAVSELFQPPLLRNEGTEADKAAAAAGLPGYERIVAAVAPALTRGLKLADPCRRESWEQLELHIEQTQRLATLLAAVWGGRGDAKAAAGDLYDWARRHETRLQPWFDLFEYIWTMSRALNLPEGI